METGIAKRVALVNGASKGIGKAIAKGLSYEGVLVCIVARDESILVETAREISKETGHRVIYKAADIAKPNTPKELVEYVTTTLGSLDILINNSGGPSFGSLMNLTEDDWETALQLSLRSSIRCTKEAIPHMQKNSWGRIVNVTSTVAKEPGPTMILSATARAGLAAFAKALSIELAPQGITVNTVCPGGVLTDRLRGLLVASSKNGGRPYEELLEQSQKSIPMGRFATPEEFSDYVVFLCSERGRYMTGTYTSVDGGLTKGL